MRCMDSSTMENTEQNERATKKCATPARTRKEPAQEEKSRVHWTQNKNSKIGKASCNEPQRRTSNCVCNRLPPRGAYGETTSGEWSGRETEEQLGCKRIDAGYASDNERKERLEWKTARGQLNRVCLHGQAEHNEYGNRRKLMQTSAMLSATIEYAMNAAAICHAKP